MHGKHILAIPSRLTSFHEREDHLSGSDEKVGIVIVSVRSQAAGRRRRLGVENYP